MRRAIEFLCLGKNIECDFPLKNEIACKAHRRSKMLKFEHRYVRRVNKMKLKKEVKNFNYIEYLYQDIFNDIADNINFEDCLIFDN